MQQNSIPSYLLLSSLFSTQELKIDAQNNLVINTLSQTKETSKTIPLDLIDKNPEISRKPNLGLLSLSLVLTVVATSLILTSSAIALPASLFFVAIATIAVAFKVTSKTYSFFYANSKSPLFTLHASHTKALYIESFINQLQKSMEINSDVDNQPTDISEYTQRLDFLYEHELLTDISYARIKNKIKEKHSGSTSNDQLADVIYLPIKKA